LAAAYVARRAGAAPDWKPLPIQYADYSVWQRIVLGDVDNPESELARQLAYWRTTLAGAPEQLDLPTARARPMTSTDGGASVPFRIDRGVHDALRNVARQAHATLFMVVQAAVAALLHRMGAGTDIPIGTVIAGRTDRQLDDLVGFFVNTIVLRIDASVNPTWREMIARAQRTGLDAYAHADVPFERLVDAINPERSPSRHPLFQVLLTVEQQPER